MGFLQRFITITASFGTGVFFTWLARITAVKMKFYNQPNPIVKTHSKPVPYLGGAGIFLPMVILTMLFSFFSIWSIVFSVMIMSFVILGTIDDYRPLPWWVKLIAQIVIITVFFPLSIKILGFHPDIYKTGICVLFILVLTNGFNIIDVADGLASGIGLTISIGIFLGFRYFSTLLDISIIPLLMTGLLGGFLVFNKPKASIFLGDGGSLPLGAAIGFLLATWLLSEPVSFPRVSYAANLSSIIIFEIFLVVYHRFKKGISPFKGSPDHFALRLAKTG